ncbi:MAG: TerC family protein [Pseudomonadota bacterium]
MEWLLDPEAWIVFATLTAVEIVLGIDNIVFISILAGKLPSNLQPRARMIGLTLAMVTRILLLLSLLWFMGITRPLFSIANLDVSVRDLILVAGGLFLLGKSTVEVHDKLEGMEGRSSERAACGFTAVIMQIALLDIVFSLDSVITAIGLANQIGIMMLAIVFAVIFMLFCSKTVSDFIERHPTVQMLALSFLLLIGLTLVADGCHMHIPKGYIYFAMAFSVFVEMLNTRIRKRTEMPLRLRKAYLSNPPEEPSLQETGENGERQRLQSSLGDR